MLTLPIAAGRVETWRRFCQVLAGSQRSPYEASRLRLGITRERLALLDNPLGANTIITIESYDLTRALAGLIRSPRPFESWYRERLQAIHGLSLSRFEEFSQAATVSPQEELLFEWTRPSG